MGSYQQHPILNQNRKISNGCNDNGMGFTIPFLSDLEDKANEYIDSAKQQLVDWGVDPKDIDAVSAQATAALEAEKEKAAQQLLAQITGTSGGMEAIKPSILPSAVQDQIDALNKNAIMAAIPGGVYTVVGVGAATILYLILRK